MKLLGIVLLFSGSMWSVATYITNFKEQIEELKDWEKILSSWKIWLIDYSYSLEELLEQTAQNIATKQLKTTSKIINLNIEKFKLYLREDSKLPLTERTVLMQVINEFGTTLKNNQVHELERCVNTLEKTIIEKDKIIKERSALLYKITPLFVGAVAVLLW